MIHVDREQTDETGTAIEPNAAWFALATQRTALALEQQGNHEADGAVYAHPEVRKALERLFGDKCAYCEQTLESWEVDHFRPKGRVAERQDHPGYYWLTYGWQNLYPACVHCNQHRKDRPRWADPAGLAAAGKADQFPLSDESTRAMTPGDDVNQEQRLLIDPCIDDPEDYFGYDPFGQILSLRDPEGSKTIEVFHLYRRRLKDFRRQVILAVVQLTRLLVKLGDSGAREPVAELTDYLERLKGNGSPYSGTARYVANHLAAFGV